MFTLPPLPYAVDALEPAIARWVVQRHYEDNHAGYYNKVNQLLGDSPHRFTSILEVARFAVPNTPLANAARQAWIHDFWWRSMSPEATTPPNWYSASQFEKRWVDIGSALFGSGWLWLTLSPAGKFEIHALPNAEIPARPVLVMDLWEHAYYCQYGTQRAEFLRQTLKHLNWAEAERRVRGGE